MKTSFEQDDTTTAFDFESGFFGLNATIDGQETTGDNAYTTTLVLRADQMTGGSVTVNFTGQLEFDGFRTAIALLNLALSQAYGDPLAGGRS